MSWPVSSSAIVIASSTVVTSGSTLVYVASSVAYDPKYGQPANPPLILLAHLYIGPKNPLFAASSEVAALTIPAPATTAISIPARSIAVTLFTFTPLCLQEFLNPAYVVSTLHM